MENILIEDVCPNLCPFTYKIVDYHLLVSNFLCILLVQSSSHMRIISLFPFFKISIAFVNSMFLHHILMSSRQMVRRSLKYSHAPQNNIVLLSLRPTFSNLIMSKKCSTWMDGSLFVQMVVISMVRMISSSSECSEDIKKYLGQGLSFRG